ncbi:MAG: NADH-quinone oxidoreductase subunit J [Burkholderiales bacterium]|nr:NADH-quinone oxidoreductase subunit J [Burkholderiales bacterium]
MINIILFYAFAAILIISALWVITAKNPVHSVLFLVLSFVTASCLWLMLNVEFLALSLILIYVGAVMVLFLFVVMMLDIDLETLRSGFWKNLPLALLLGVVILSEMILVLVTKPIVVMGDSTTNIASKISNSYQVGWLMYTEYSYPVELASLILLLGLVVAVALTLRKTNKNAKYQNIDSQVATVSKDRIKMVKIPTEVDSFMVRDNIEGEIK